MLHLRIDKSLIIIYISVLILCGTAVYPKSKYEKITNGIGNVIVGEVLPYNDDSGFKNVVSDSVTLSQLRTWNSFYYRAFFNKKISEINHDVRVLVINFKGVGGKSSAFEKDQGGNVITWTLREEDSAEYGERSEWSRYYPDFQSKPATFDYYIRPYDCSKPETFTFGTGSSDIIEGMNFDVNNLEQWKKEYNLTSIIVTMQVFSFTDDGTETKVQTKKVIEAKGNMNGTYELEEKEKMTGIKTSTKWGNRKLLAKGKFTIVLD